MWRGYSKHACSKFFLQLSALSSPVMHSHQFGDAILNYTLELNSVIAETCLKFLKDHSVYHSRIINPEYLSRVSFRRLLFEDVNQIMLVHMGDIVESRSILVDVRANSWA